MPFSLNGSILAQEEKSASVRWIHARQVVVRGVIRGKAGAQHAACREQRECVKADAGAWQPHTGGPAQRSGGARGLQWHV